MRFYLKHDREPNELKTGITKPYRKRDIEQVNFMGEEIDFDDTVEMILKNTDLDFGLFHEFLDHFQLHGGFDSLRKALQKVVPFETEHTLPLELIPSLTSPFKSCSNILNPEYSREMAEELQSIIIGRLENMTDEEMKDVDKNTIK